MSRGRLGVVLSLLFATALLIRLAAHLPADTFLVGDQGVKLVAVRNALAHPTRPFGIDAPVLSGTSLPDLMDPFFRPHGDHAHAVTSALFPLVVAPFYAAFGFAGLVILSIAGFLGALVGLEQTARRLEDTPPGASVMWVALLTSPLLFYGLEFWEHAPAAGLAYLATPQLVEAARTKTRLVASGALLGAAIAMRPEAVCYVAALWIASRALPRPLRLSEVITCAAGIGLVLLPFASYNVLHLGTITGTHEASNTPSFDSGWLPMRWALWREWFWPTGGIGAALVTGAIAAGVVSRFTQTPSRWPRLVILAAGSGLAILAARRAFPLESLWAAAPAALVMFVPISRSSTRSFVLRLLVLTVALVVAMAPNDGGGQWGPRYMMLASGPAALGTWLVLRETWRDRRLIELLLVVTLLAASAGVQRQSFKELRAIKESYGRLQRGVAIAAQGVPVLTDIWWLDQVAGTHGPPPLFLVTNTDRASAAVARLRAAGVPAFAIVTITAPETEARVASWLAGTSFRLHGRRTIDEFSMTVYAVNDQN